MPHVCQLSTWGGGFEIVAKAGADMRRAGVRALLRGARKIHLAGGGRRLVEIVVPALCDLEAPWTTSVGVAMSGAFVRVSKRSTMMTALGGW